MIVIGVVVCLCVTFLTAYRWYLKARPEDEAFVDLETRIEDHDFKLAHLPAMPAIPCTQEEFAKVVNQLNTLTKDMEVVSQTAESLRSAMGMQQMAGGRRT